MERCQTQGNYNFDDDRQRKLTPYPGGFNTNWDGHHDGGVVGQGGQFPLSANALSGWVFLNNLH